MFACIANGSFSSTVYGQSNNLNATHTQKKGGNDRTCAYESVQTIDFIIFKTKNTYEIAKYNHKYVESIESIDVIQIPFCSLVIHGKQKALSNWHSNDFQCICKAYFSRVCTTKIDEQVHHCLYTISTNFDFKGLGTKQKKRFPSEITVHFFRKYTVFESIFVKSLVT